MKYLAVVLVYAVLLGAAEKKEVKPVPSSITITVGDLLDLAISGALNKLVQQELPVALAFHINETIDAISPHIQQALKARDGIYTDDNSVKVPDHPGERTIKPEKADDIKAKFDALITEKVTVIMSPLDLEVDTPGIKLSARDVKALTPLLKKK